MPAVPVVVTISITVSTELGTLKVTGTLAVPSPSLTVTSPMVTLGVASLSTIVTSPMKSLLAASIVPLTSVPFTVNFSFGSSIKSSVIGITTFTVVCPAGMVTCIVVAV